MGRRKADHKHIYQYYLRPREQCTHEWFDLMKVCSVCGYIKSPSMSECLSLRRNGFTRWMLTKEDFEEVYGELPILMTKEG